MKINRLSGHLFLTLNSLFLIFILQPVYAVIPLETSPSWRSTESGVYSTGAVFGDIDGNGFLDLVISNGNDIVKAPNFVYFNFKGKLDATAGWVSSNSEYSGHCALGDIDKDGYLELAVSNYINTGWDKIVIQLYDNVNGSLTLSPVWSSADSMHSFACSFGDADGDGDLDLAVACGEAYNKYYENNRIYFNQNGVLETTPSWISADTGTCYDVDWGDVDNDGDLDLVIICARGQARVYKNHGDSIETAPSWQSRDADNRNSLAWGDIDNDGYLDLAVANNTQIAGSRGYFEVYSNNSGVLDTIPFWESSTSGYGSSVSFCDVDNDGDRDLAAGRWWGLSSVYENTGGNLTSTPSWSCNSSYESVIEEMVWADLDGDGLIKIKNETHLADGIKKVYYFDHYPVHKLDSIIVADSILSLNDFCYNLTSGWVAFKVPPISEVKFNYKVSLKTDLAVSNWDRENFCFFNLNKVYRYGDTNNDQDVTVSDVVFLISFLFRGGEEPYFLASGDTNDDCQTSVSDVIFLINHLFKGGPEPLAGCAK
ncbi:MAG: VCBS repeat-containing protein [candidate division Zixibacteria bacterium]|nr:VCBS repeat-containing protein [candidate division Zixibacteria bacterium]